MSKAFEPQLCKPGAAPARLALTALACLVLTATCAGAADKPVLRTPDERFAALPGFDYTPHYFQVSSQEFGSLRMHYVDEGEPDAPYPDESYKTGPTAFTLINPVRPDDPPIAANRAAWANLADWKKPVLTLYGDLIAKTAFSPTRFHDHVPGTQGQPHYLYPNRSFYFLEDDTADIARRIISFVENTPLE